MEGREELLWAVAWMLHNIITWWIRIMTVYWVFFLFVLKNGKHRRNSYSIEKQPLEIIFKHEVLQCSQVLYIQQFPLQRASRCSTFLKLGTTFRSFCLGTIKHIHPYIKVKYRRPSKTLHGFRFLLFPLKWHGHSVNLFIKIRSCRPTLTPFHWKG